MPGSIVELGSRRWASAVVSGRCGCLKRAKGIAAERLTFRTNKRERGIFHPQKGVFTPCKAGFDLIYHDDLHASVGQTLLPLLYRSHVCDEQVEYAFCNAMLALSTVASSEMSRERMIQAFMEHLKLIGVNGGPIVDCLILNDMEETKLCGELADMLSDTVADPANVVPFHDPA